MITDGLKLTSYFGERQRANGRFAADALLDLYGQHRVAASVLLYEASRQRSLRSGRPQTSRGGIR